MKKNGFTLIELLAVILILGIIALIAVPVVNDVLNDSRMGAFKSTAMNLATKAEETCQLEGIKDKEVTKLYTIVNGKIDKPIDIKGDVPNEGYILINNNCEVAYSFYDSKNVVSKTFKESNPTVNNKDTAPAYGLKWQSNTVEGDDYLTDTYTRTLDASDIEDNSVKVQIGETPVTNVFDELDIYKDILPITDEFGNEFILIPKFYISKTKELTNTEVIWKYAVSKHKLDSTYYLPSCFVDEGEDNNQNIELPYVLVGKYEAGSNGLTGSNERLVSKSGLMPRVGSSIVSMRNMIRQYNTNDGVNGYHQYDIHIHDLLTMLFAIEFKTMNSQNIMSGYVNNSKDSEPILTGGSDSINSSSGSPSATNASFNYRGIENLWGNIYKFVDGVVIDQINGTQDLIYTARNARYYSSSGSVTEYYELVEQYRKLNANGFVAESGFDSNKPFINLPIKIGGDDTTGIGDYYYQNIDSNIKVMLTSDNWHNGLKGGMNRFRLTWYSDNSFNDIGTRIVKAPLS